MHWVKVFVLGTGWNTLGTGKKTLAPLHACVWYLEGYGVAVNGAGFVAAGGISCSVTVAVFKEPENSGGRVLSRSGCWCCSGAHDGVLNWLRKGQECVTIQESQCFAWR